MREHCAHKHHKITKDSINVLAREDVWLKRKVREAIEIKIGQPAMNRNQGYELTPIYDELLLSCDRRQGDHMTSEGEALRLEARSIRKLATSEKIKTLKGNTHYYV